MGTLHKSLAPLALTLLLPVSGTCQLLGNMPITIPFNYLNGPSTAVANAQSISLVSNGPFKYNTAAFTTPVLDQTVSFAYSVPFWVLKDRNLLLGELSMAIAHCLDNQAKYELMIVQNQGRQSLIKQLREGIQQLQERIDLLISIQDDLYGPCSWRNFNTYPAQVHAEVMYKDILSNNGLLMTTEDTVELHNVPRSSLEGPVVGTKLIYKK